MNSQGGTTLPSHGKGKKPADMIPITQDSVYQIVPPNQALSLHELRPGAVMDDPIRFSLVASLLPRPKR